MPKVLSASLVLTVVLLTFFPTKQARGEIFVANSGAPTMIVFSDDAQGNATPIR